MPWLLGIVAAIAIGFAGPPVLAASHHTSTNVAVIPNYTGTGYDGGWAGTLVPAWFPQYTFTPVIPPQVTGWQSLAQFDTVILYQFCNINSYPAFTSNLVAWVQHTGGKLLIWDSDSCANDTYYGWLAPLGASFDRYSPGQTGNSGGSLTILENNGLGSSNPTSPYYVNTAAMVTQTDAVGDLNVVNENTVSPVWCAHMRGTNTYNRSGFGHMYSTVGGLNGAPDALLIYCGIDTDYIEAPGPSGGGQIQKVLALDLAHGWGPPGSPQVADLTCQVAIGNLALGPSPASNYVGQVHTVTATFTLQNNSVSTPVPGATITFIVTNGPNVGLSGTGVTDVNGQTTFSYTSTNLGTDFIVATSTLNTNTYTSNLARKIWGLGLGGLWKFHHIQGTNVSVGDTFFYEISFDTLGNSVWATNVMLIDFLPLELDFVSATTNGALSFTVISNRLLVWDFGTQPPGIAGPTNYVTVRVNAYAANASIITNKVSLYCDNLPPIGAVDVDPDCPTCTGEEAFR